MPPRRVGKDRTHLPFIIFKEIYTNRCFMDKNILNENGASILKTSCENENEKSIVVHALTTEFFMLHTLNLDDMELWDHMNLKGFFELLAWGPHYIRAYQALTSLTQDNFFTVIKLDGEQKHLQMTRSLVQEALNLPSGEPIDFFKLCHLDEDNRVCSNSNKPMWDELN